MAMIKGLPVTEPSIDGIQAALGLSGYTAYKVLMRPDLYGPKADIVQFWAKYQPLSAPIFNKLTEKQREEYAYGIKDNENYSLNDSTRGPVLAYNNALSGKFSLWRDKPSGDINTSPFRPGDYFSEDGTLSYNNEAVCPFSFEVEEITDRGFAQITAIALSDYQLPPANITVRDLRFVGGVDSIISLDDNTCFGLLYTKDGGSVQVLGADGKYKVFNGLDSERTSDIHLVGDGVYKIVYIILNTATQRFITLPYSPQEVTVTSDGLVRGYIEVFGEYEYNSSGSQLTIRNLTIIPRGAQAVAGNVALYICDASTPSNNIENEALYTTSFAYDATEKDTERVLFASKTITANGWDARNIIPWVATTAESGEVYRTQLDWIDNSGDIE